MSRRYSSISVQTTLATGVSNTALIIPLAVGTAAGLLGGVTLAAANADQFSIMMEPDTLGAEIMWVTGISGDNLTVLRGKDGTSAIAHSGGAVVKHILTSGDLIYFAAGVVPVSTLSTGLPFPGATSGTNTLVAPAITGIVTNTLPATTGTLMSAESVDAAVSKTTPVDADEIPIADSAATFGLKKLTWANVKATMLAYLNSVVNRLFTAPVEVVNIVAAAPTATQNIDASTAGVWWFTTNAANNTVLNFRSSASVSLNTLLVIGQALTFAIRITNGATPYYVTSITIDGGAITLKWIGTAPIAGDASAADVYSFVITKTAAATFDVVAQMVKVV